MSHSSAIEKFQLREADRERRAKKRALHLEEQEMLRKRRLERRQIQMELRITRRQRQSDSQARHLRRIILRTHKKKKEAFSRDGHHQAIIDRQNHSALEFRYREVYGKWPSALELNQAGPFLKKRRSDQEE